MKQSINQESTVTSKGNLAKLTMKTNLLKLNHVRIYTDHLHFAESICNMETIKALFKSRLTFCQLVKSAKLVPFTTHSTTESDKDHIYHISSFYVTGY